MGYYSDVALALTKRGKEQFMLALESAETSMAAKEQVPRLLGWADKHLVEDDGSESWYWKQIKWYTDWPEDFADVYFIDNILSELSEEEFYFARIGEEHDDNEIRGLWWDNPFGISLCREIVLDC